MATNLCILTDNRTKSNDSDILKSYGSDSLYGFCKGQAFVGELLLSTENRSSCHSWLENGLTELTVSQPHLPRSRQFLNAVDLSPQKHMIEFFVLALYKDKD